MSAEAKKCSVCYEVKPLSEFYRQKMNQCKVCRNVVIAKWRSENKSKFLLQMKESSKEWYKKNKEKAKQKQATYAKNNKSSVNARAAKRRAMQLKLTPEWADKQEIAMFYEVAEVLSRGGVEFHVDHIIPLQGKKAWGFHSQHNLQVIPAYQNISKGNRHDAH